MGIPSAGQAHVYGTPGVHVILSSWSVEVVHGHSLVLLVDIAILRDRPRAWGGKNILLLAFPGENRVKM